MDGFDELVKSDQWAKLVIARQACFNLQKSLEADSFSSDFVFEARIALNTVENQLRHYFKFKKRTGQI